MKKRFKFTPLQIVVHAAAWVILGWVVWEYYASSLNINPIQTATQHTGKIALAMMIV